MKKKLVYILIIGLILLLSGCGLLRPHDTDAPAIEENIAASTENFIELQKQTLRLPLLINSMTVEEKVAQLFIARFPDSDAVANTEQYQPGGYIYFADDFKQSNPQSFLATTEQCNAVSKIPLLLGVDEEGGTVVRISRYSQYRDLPFPSPQDLYAQGGLEAVKTDTAEKCQLLKSLGLNLNFAPVCDVTTNADDYIYYRTTGRDATATGEYVSSVVKIMNEQNVGSVLKHFPGYGSNSDTHSGLAYDSRSYDNFVNNDFLPFQAGIDAGASMVLVSHNIVACMDANMPASLSAPVHQILRDELGFNGVIITDDLVMGAIKEYTGTTSPAAAAIKAGNDMICTSDFNSHYQQLLAAVNNGEISIDQINESLYRVLTLKDQLGLLQQ